MPDWFQWFSEVHRTARLRAGGPCTLSVVVMTQVVNMLEVCMVEPTLKPGSLEYPTVTLPVHISSSSPLPNRPCRCGCRIATLLRAAV
jgi:hypothetical protein